MFSVAMAPVAANSVDLILSRAKDKFDTNSPEEKCGNVRPQMYL